MTATHRAKNIPVCVNKFAITLKKDVYMANLQIQSIKDLIMSEPES